MRFGNCSGMRAPFAGSILTDGGYEAIRAVRPAPVVLIDCFREGLNTPTALSRALRSLDGQGHRLVRITSADPKDYADDRGSRSCSRRGLSRRARPQHRGGARR